jgi:hypothetical protein
LTFLNKNVIYRKKGIAQTGGTCRVGSEWILSFERLSMSKSIEYESELEFIFTPPSQKIREKYPFFPTTIQVCETADYSNMPRLQKTNQRAIRVVLKGDQSFTFVMSSSIEERLYELEICMKTKQIKMRSRLNHYLAEENKIASLLALCFTIKATREMAFISFGRRERKGSEK